MTPTDGTTRWIDDLFRYEATVRDGDLIRLRCAMRAALPRDDIDMLAWLEREGMDDKISEFLTRAKRENELDWRRERDDAAAAAAEAVDEAA